MIWSSVQKMWASSWVNARTRMQAVQRAGRLVAMHLAELGEPQRQVPVALQPLVEDLDMAGAVHRLDGEDALVRRLRQEHVLAELLEVSGLQPQAHDP